jgi:hypothetical protein
MQDQGRYADAEPLLLASYEAQRTAANVPAGQLLTARDRLARLYVGWGKRDQAERWRAPPAEVAPRPRPAK